jgi:hypothetical protein
LVAFYRAAEEMVSAFRDPRQRNSVAALSAVCAAMLLGLIWFLAGGGNASAARAAANAVMDAASLAFVLYFAAAPLSRLIAAASTQALGRARAGIAFVFGGMYGVFLVWIVAPYYFAREHMPLPALTFVLFSAAILTVFLAGAGRRGYSRSGSGRALQGLSTGYFWLVFAIDDLDHLLGPYRLESGFHGFSLALLALALLIRLADMFVERRKAVFSARVV